MFLSLEHNYSNIHPHGGDEGGVNAGKKRGVILSNIQETKAERRRVGGRKERTHMHGVLLFFFVMEVEAYYAHRGQKCKERKELNEIRKRR